MGAEGTKGIRAWELGGRRSVEKNKAGEATPSGRIWCIRIEKWGERAGGGDLTSQDILVVFRRRAPSL